LSHECKSFTRAGVGTNGILEMISVEKRGPYTVVGARSRRTRFAGGKQSVYAAYGALAEVMVAVVVVVAVEAAVVVVVSAAAVAAVVVVGAVEV
jgi:hypothetical protein